MKDYEKYSIDTEIKYEPLTLMDLDKIQKDCKKEWQNLSLCRINDCVVRLGVIHGEFHWHKHDNEDEFFYVIEGRLLIDLEDRTEELHPKQSFMIPREVLHRTRAPERTVILMVEGSGVVPTGD